jgi:hypothetical protein
MGSDLSEPIACPLEMIGPQELGLPHPFPRAFAASREQPSNIWVFRAKARGREGSMGAS